MIYTYSQHGEDMFLNDNYFHYKMNGKFIELGAHDGVALSNTKMFEDHFNWTGILIEPHPLTFSKLKENRPNCFLFNDVVSNIKEEINFKCFDLHNMGAISSVEETISDRHNKDYFENENYKPVRQYTLKLMPKTLTEIIKSTCIDHFDLLSLDVEGHEYEVLKSWDFSVPIDVIIIETLEHFEELNEKCREILKKNGYRFDTKQSINEIYVLNK